MTAKSRQPTKNVLITGGAGFIGSNTTILLVNKYPSYNFIVVDKLTYGANLKNLSSVFKKANFKFIYGSITSRELMRHVFAEYKITTVIHFAAETHVDKSFNHAFEFTETNVMGTHILLECARRAFQQQDQFNKNSRFELFIHVSTDEVYGESEMDATYKDAKKETDRLLPTNPYSASKAAAEQIVHSYARSFKIPIIVTRSSNIYGPRQFPEKLIPKFINLIKNGKAVCIHGDGRKKRVYVHVDDVANAFDMILHKGKIGEIYNITSDDELETVQVSEKIFRCFGGLNESEYKKYTTFVVDRLFNDTRYYMNGDKMKELGWETKVSFMTGLKQTVDWYLDNPHHWKNLDGVLVAHWKNYVENNTVYGGDVIDEQDIDQKEDK